MLRVPVGTTAAEVVSGISEWPPDLLALSLTTRQWKRAQGLVREIREEIDVPIVAGGLHPTFSAEEVLASPGFDYVCLGEGVEKRRGGFCGQVRVWAACKDVAASSAVRQ